MSQPITVLFATMTGNARDCAERIVGTLTRAGHSVIACDLAKYVASQILSERTALVCISTWGDGEPPDDGVDFVDFLRSLEAGSLGRLSYSVLALGDTGYEHFCQCGKDVDTLLEARGAQRIAPRVDCDMDFEDNLAAWIESVATALAVRQEIAA